MAPAHQRRLLAFATVIGLAGFVAASDALHEMTVSMIDIIDTAVDRHPVAGLALFVALAMLSAMLAFFSSAVLVPVGVSTWGPATCFALLWAGWLLGGIVSFTIGRYFGNSIAPKLLGAGKLDHFRALLARHTTFLRVVLFQAAVPSEIPGYVLGVLRYPARLYLLALALTELPYALGTVYLGAAFLERRSVLLLVVGVAAMLVSVLLYRLHQRHVGIDPA